MVTANLLSTRWALYGKEPGGLEDYGLLGASHPAEAEESVPGFIPGTPNSAPPGDPIALPWITTGGLVDGAGTRRLAMAVCEWPEPPRLDHFSRPSALTRYFE